MESSRVIKIVSIICFALIALILIVLRNSPTTGYESSIYTDTPPIVWGVLIFSIVCGIGIILHQLYTRKEEKSNLWVIGLLLVTFGLVVLFSVDVLRGYVTSGGLDSVGITAKVKDIISSGHFESRDFYPIFYIHIAQLSQICNITAMKLLGYMPAFFAVLFILFMYLFARTVLPQKGQVILATLAGMVLLASTAHGQTSLAPHGTALLVATLVFFLCVKSLSVDSLSLKTQFSLLLIIMIFFFPPFHIISTFAILLTMLTLWLPVEIYNIWGRRVTQTLPNSYRLITPAALLMFVWGTTWFSSFYMWEVGIRRLYATIVEGGATHLAEIEFGILEAGRYGYSVWEILFKRYSTDLLYLTLALISVPILIKKVSSNRNLGKLLPLYGPLAVLVLAALMFFVFRLPFAPQRFVYYALIICTIFVGFVFYEVMERARNTTGKGYLARLCLWLMVLLLVLVTVNGVFTRYYSRYILLSSAQISSREMKGMDWFVNRKDINLASIYYLTAPFQYEHLFLTPEELKKRIRITSEKRYSRPPWHFNYDKKGMLGESYTEDSYLVLNEKGKSRFVDIFPEMAEFRFYPADFDRLEDDPSIDKLYTNGGLDVWYVHPLVHSP